MQTFPVFDPEVEANEGYMIAQFFSLFWSWFTSLVLFSTLASLAVFGLVAYAANTGKLTINSWQDGAATAGIMFLCVVAFVLNFFKTVLVLRKQPTKNAYTASVIQSIVMCATALWLFGSMVMDVASGNMHVFPPDWSNSGVVLAWFMNLFILIPLVLGCVVLVIVALGYGRYSTGRMRAQKRVKEPTKVFMIRI